MDCIKKMLIVRGIKDGIEWFDQLIANCANNRNRRVIDAITLKYPLHFAAYY